MGFSERIDTTLNWTELRWPSPAKQQQQQQQQQKQTNKQTNKQSSVECQ